MIFFFLFYVFIIIIIIVVVIIDAFKSHSDCNKTTTKTLILLTCNEINREKKVYLQDKSTKEEDEDEEERFCYEIF
jgi:hypothetical protein